MKITIRENGVVKQVFNVGAEFFNSVFKCSVCEHYIDKNGDVALPRDYTEYELNSAPLTICNICEEQEENEMRIQQQELDNPPGMNFPTDYRDKK